MFTIITWVVEQVRQAKATARPMSAVYMLPEKPADTISEVLNSKDFPHFAQKIGCLTGVCL